jgi:CheY-like chemotaxis protein
MPLSVRILVIEDNRENIELVEYLLTVYGYSPVLAMTGEEGLRIAAELKPDVILLDLRLPGIDGYDVAVAIRKLSGLEKTRIVAVTASAMVGDRERIVAAGFDGYIQKPIDPENFIGQIERWLPDGASRTTAA